MQVVFETTRTVAEDHVSVRLSLNKRTITSKFTIVNTNELY